MKFLFYIMLISKLLLLFGTPIVLTLWMRPLKIWIILNDDSIIDLKSGQNFTKILRDLCTSWETHGDINIFPIMFSGISILFFGGIQGITWLQTRMTARQEGFSLLSITIGLFWFITWVMHWTCQTIEIGYGLCNFVIPFYLLWVSLLASFITFSIDIFVLIYNYFDKTDLDPLVVPFNREVHVSILN